MEYDKLSELAQRVITGKATIARLDKDEEQGRIAGGRRNVEATNPNEHVYIIDANVSLNTDKPNGGVRDYMQFEIV